MKKNKAPHFYRDGRLDELAEKAISDNRISGPALRLILLVIREIHDDKSRQVSAPFPLTGRHAAGLLGINSHDRAAIAIKNLLVGYIWFVEKRGCPPQNWYRLAVPN